jgi:GH15 family glucan-1,4-alpha-glucosidase
MTTSDTDRPHAAPDLVETSLAVIRAGQAPSGALTAGPTFSQYGYSWFRDGAFIAEGLSMAGEIDAADRFHHWVARIVLASADGIERARKAGRLGRVPHVGDYLHCRYSADGQPSQDDGWFTFQLDGPGIWLWSLTRHLLYGGRLDDELRAAIGPTARYLADLWTVPCADAWEEHEDKVHTSTLAAIRAGLESAASLEPGLADAPAVADARAGLAAWMSEGDGAYTKWAGSDEVDASLLWMAAPYETVLAAEPRFAATLERIERDIIDPDGGVHRFASDTFYGGGAWPVLTSAYARVLLRRGEPGDLERALAALRWIEAQADEQGYLPEQVPDHALAPDRIDGWREEWGESARPLLWSHASYLALRIELAERVDLHQPST